MMRKMTAMALTMVLLAAALPVLASDSGADPLTWAELKDWAAGLVEASEGMEPMNDPSDEASKTEDGYAYLYDFGTLYFSKPVQRLGGC